MRIGVFGGTFDPVHLGHLILAEQSREQARLDRVLFIPSARPPNKQHQAVTPFAQRVEMLALAIAGHSAFQIDELEKDRPGPSYTVDTLEELHRRYPGDRLNLLIGSDCLSDLGHWRDPERICQLAELLIMARPGWSIDQVPLEANVPRDMHRQIIRAPMIDLASRDLRRWAAEGRSLRYLVPRAVECHIAAHQLYQSPA